jgi:hypothetical protein
MTATQLHRTNISRLQARSPVAALREEWTAGSYGLVYLLNALSVVGLAVAWWGSSTTVVLSEQVTWLEVGVAAVVLAATADVGWLVSGRRAIGLRRAEISLRIALLAADVGPEELDAAAPVERSGDAVALVAGAGMRMFHREDCAMVLGKPVSDSTRSEHRSAGRRPCGMCRP